MESFLQRSVGQLATKGPRRNKGGGRRRGAIPLDSAACRLTVSRSLTNVLSRSFSADFVGRRWVCCRLRGCVRVARVRMREDSIVGVAL